jgi:uncharacterized protein YceK
MWRQAADLLAVLGGGLSTCSRCMSHARALTGFSATQLATVMIALCRPEQQWTCAELHLADFTVLGRRRAAVHGTSRAAVNSYLEVVPQLARSLEATPMLV